jgi:hypothetical protein
MKKYVAASGVLVAALLAGCSSASDNADSPGTASTTTSSTVTSSDPTSATPPASDSSSEPSSATDDGTTNGSAYCAELASAKSQFDNIDFSALDDRHFTQLTDEFDSIAALAPGQVKSDWATLSSALKQVQQILGSAGLSFDDLQKLSSGQVPNGVTPKELTRVGRQLSHFSQDKSFARAAAEISRDAKAECGIRLGS